MTSSGVRHRRELAASPLSSEAQYLVEKAMITIHGTLAMCLTALHALPDAADHDGARALVLRFLGESLPDYAPAAEESPNPPAGAPS